MKRKSGPKKKTIKDKHGNILVFYIKDNKLNVIGKLDHVSGMELSSANIRSLSNWLNWFRDNK